MAHAFRLAVEAGREAFLAGLIEEQTRAEASSPLAGAVHEG
jgi:thiazole synthase